MDSIPGIISINLCQLYRISSNADEFQSSPAPLYIVINGDVISEDGRDLYNEVVDTLLENSNINGVPRGVWDTIRDSTSSNEELSVIMSDLESNQSKWDDLTAYLTSEDGRNLTSSNLEETLVKQFFLSRQQLLIGKQQQILRMS